MNVMPYHRANLCLPSSDELVETIPIGLVLAINAVFGEGHNICLKLIDIDRRSGHSRVVLLPFEVHCSQFCSFK